MKRNKKRGVLKNKGMGKIFDKFRQSIKEVNKDIFIGVVSEDGVVKSSFKDEYSMSFTFCAYTKNDSDLIKKEIYVTKEIPSFETKIKGIEALTIIQISGEEFTYHNQKRIKLDKVLKSNVDHKELEDFLVKRNEPVIYESSVLGKFELDRRLDWYEGKADWDGNTIDIFLNGELKKIDITEKNAISILKDQQEWNLFIKSKICEELLKLKNENWLEEGENPLTADEFISKIYLESIAFNDTDVFQMYFNDGDIFWGHAITIETDFNKIVEHIGIEG